MDKLTTLYVRALNEVEGALEPRKGQGLVEYVLILALIAVVLVGILGTLSDSIEGTFQDVIDALDGAG